MTYLESRHDFSLIDIQACLVDGKPECYELNGNVRRLKIECVRENSEKKLVSIWWQQLYNSNLYSIYETDE